MPPLVTSDMTLEQVQEFFKSDKFATHIGCVVTAAGKGHAVTELELRPEHRNGMGGVMGGCIFTLADFALAVGCNVDEEPTMSVSNTIEYLAGAKGSKLIATCNVDRSGRTLGYYTVDVTDDLGTKVARMVATCFRRA
ncbi:MAG: PaaI family thioesterase [Coriobacteriia bacterium]|nr:PaaI family thioesterase [Coriobacteriia bacterium]